MSKPRLSLRGLAILLLASVPLFFSSEALRKGQVIKQFFAYSITQSLRNDPLQPLSTGLPCNPPRAWVEEPPVFHYLGAMGLWILPDFSALIPILAFLGMALALSNLGSWPAVLAVMYSPIYLRYSIQHIPDLLAVTFLCLGALFLFRRSRYWAWGLFGLAVATKALTIFAVVPLLGWDVWTRYRKVSAKVWSLSFALPLVLLSFPFILWLVVIFASDLPNPFLWNNGIENRHSGSLTLLFKLSYWARFFTWVALKGVGVVLFGASLVRLVRVFRKGIERDLDGMLSSWSAGVLVYWLLVRQGNYVHDYYTLPFAAPIALLGAREILTLRKRELKYGLIGISILIGVFNLARTMPTASDDPTLGRPQFCDWEK